MTKAQIAEAARALDHSALDTAMAERGDLAMLVRRLCRRPPDDDRVALLAREYLQKGIDVSGWQPSIDWGAVAAGGIAFAYVKATQGTGYRSKSAPKQVAGACAAGVAVGLYHFAEPSPDDDPETEAEHFLKFARLLEAEGAVGLRPVLDIETTGGASSTRLNLWALRWCAAVDKAGCAPVVYTYESFLRQHFAHSALSGYPLWVAKYSTRAPKVAPWSEYAMWQYTQKGVVPGIKGHVDMNRGVPPGKP